MIRFRKGKEGDQMTVLEARQEPQPMADRDRIDIAKNRCAIVFESMQLTPEEIAVVTEEINEAANMLIDDDDDDITESDSLTVMEHIVMGLAIVMLLVMIIATV